MSIWDGFYCYVHSSLINSYTLGEESRSFYVVAGRWYSQLARDIKYLGCLIWVEGISGIIFLSYFYISAILITES